MISNIILHLSRLIRRDSISKPKRRSLSQLNYAELMEIRMLLSAVHVIEAPLDVEFVDMGYDSSSNEVGIVGYIDDGGDKTATIFELNGVENGFDSATLADLPDATGKAQVFGVSSDGSRVAGLSNSPNSSNQGEGTSWLRTSPSSPVGVGFISGFNNFSVAVGAWKDGIVGQSGGGARAITWNQETGINELPGTNGFIAEAKDVSANGEIVVGDSSHEVSNGVAYCWDSSAIVKLEDPFNVQSSVISVSPDGNTIGGWVGEVDEFFNVFINAAVWDRVSNSLTLLKDSNGNRFEGRVLDVSNLGYAVGETIDGRGFIWHSTFSEPLIFEDWLNERDENYSPKINSLGVVAVSEDRVNGKLRFALSDIDSAGASYFVEVDVPEIQANSVNLTLSSSTAFERDATQVTVTATSSQSVVGDQTVSVNVSGAGVSEGDYSLSAAMITIPDGQTSGSVVLTVQADQLFERDEFATVSLTEFSGGIAGGDNTSSELRIIDESQPAIDDSERYRDGDNALSWQAVDGAATYQVWLSRWSPATSIVAIESDLTTTTWQSATPLSAGTYRFWVRAFDSEESPGYWSRGFTFEIRPALIGPVGSTFDKRPVFVWDEIPAAEGYEIFVRDGVNVIRQAGITQTFWQPEIDLVGPTIRWWIRPDNSPGNRGWSTAGDLRIDGRTEILAVTPAANGGAGFTFQWSSVALIGRYILHVQRSDGSEVVIREDDVIDTSFLSSTLSTGSYRAWVKAIDSSDSFASGRWSEAFDFSVAATVDDPYDSALLKLDTLFTDSPLLAEPTGQRAVTRDDPAPSDMTTQVRVFQGLPTERERRKIADAVEHFRYRQLLSHLTTSDEHLLGDVFSQFAEDAGVALMVE